MRPLPVVLASILAAAALAAPPRTWRTVYDQMARPSALVEGARELDDVVARQTEVSGEALYFYDAQEMQSDLDEFTLDYFGDEYGPRLRGLLEKHVTADVPSFQRFVQGRRLSGFDEVLLAQAGVLVFRFTDDASRRRHLLVPVEAELYEALLHLFDVDVVDTSQAYVGLLEVPGLVALPPPPPPPSRRPVPADALPPAEVAARRGHMGDRPLRPVDVPYLALHPHAALRVVYEAGALARTDDLAASDLESLVRSGPPEERALAATALLVRDLVTGPRQEAPRLPSTETLAAMAGGLLEPRVTGPIRSVGCAALRRVPLPPLPDPFLADLLAALCDRSTGVERARVLGTAVGRAPVALADIPFPPGAEGAAFQEALAAEASGRAGLAALDLCRWLLDQELHHDASEEARVDLLRRLVADPVARAGLVTLPPPPQPGAPLRRWLAELATATDGPVAAWAAVALVQAGDSGGTLQPALAGGIGDETLHDPCLSALDLGGDRDRQGFVSFLRVLRRSGDEGERARGIFLRLVVAGESDRRELSEELPSILRGLAEPRQAPAVIALLDLLFSAEADDLVLSAMARHRERLTPSQRAACVIYLMGQGRGEGILLDGALRLAVDGLTREELRTVSTRALRQALERPWAGRVRDLLLASLTPGALPDVGEVEAAALLARPGSKLSLPEAGAVVTVLSAGLRSRAAPRAAVALEQVARSAPPSEAYWLFTLSRTDAELRAVLARAGF